MNKGDLLNLWAVLTDLQKVKANVKFSYAIAKNRMKITSEVEAIQEALKPAADFMKYENARLKLAQEYADKDDEGRVKIDGGNFSITENLTKFNEKLDALKAEHKEAIDVQEAKADEIDALLKESFEFKPHMIKFENFPEEIEPQVFEVFMQCGLVEDDLM